LASSCCESRLRKSVAKLKGNRPGRSTRTVLGPVAKLCCQSSGRFHGSCCSRSRPYPFANAISFLFLVHSAGVFPWLPNHRSEILHPHPMLDGGLLDAHLQLRQPFADLLHPDVPAQDSQRLRHRLVEGFGGHLDRVLGAGQIATGDQAGAEGCSPSGLGLPTGRS